MQNMPAQRSKLCTFTTLFVYHFLNYITCTCNFADLSEFLDERGQFGLDSVGVAIAHGQIHL